MRTNLLVDVLQLQHGHAHQAIVARKAVVLHADVQLKVLQLLFVADFAEIAHKNEKCGECQSNPSDDSLSLSL